MVKITDGVCKEKLTKILQMYYVDDYNTLVMNKDGKFESINGSKYNIHEMFIKEAIENYKFKNMPKLYNKTNNKR